jgi:polar amino acid transport system permease protein
MDAYHWDFQLVWTYKAILIHALGATLELLAATIVGAIPIGVALGLLRLRKERIPRYLAGGIVEFVRALPPLVLLIWIYYCLPVLTGLTLPAFQTLVVALALYTGVFFAEIFRAGLQSVDRGQIDAAYSVGMTGPQVLLRVTAPIAFLRVFPPFVSQCVLTIKNTALGYFVAFPELLYEGQRLSVATFRPMEFLTAVALFFVALILPLTLLAGLLERRVQRRYFG